MENFDFRELMQHSLRRMIQLKDDLFGPLLLYGFPVLNSPVRRIIIFIITILHNAF
jgi:hypothetical protein